MRLFGLLAALVLTGPCYSLTSEDIDRSIESLLEEEKLTKAPPADEFTLLRRLSLDLIGRIPTKEMLETYLVDVEPKRKERLIDRLLDTQHFADRWAEIFRQWLLGRQTKNRPLQVGVLDNWFSDRIKKGVGLDRMAREIVAAEGTVMDNPPVTILLQFERSKEDMAGHIANTLLGVKINCAQCHDHPFEKWTQKDFYGLTAFFARARQFPIPTKAYEALRKGEITRAEDFLAMMPNRPKRRRFGKNSPFLRQTQRTMDRLQRLWAQNRQDPLAWKGPDTIEEAAFAMGMAGSSRMGQKKRKAPPQLPALIEAPMGEVEIPKKDGAPPEPRRRGRRSWDNPIPPKFLDGETFDSAPFRHRRQALADWMTRPENPFFARAMVNRIWFKLMGRGLVMPVDNISNPDDETHSRLLDRLASHLVETRFDLKGMVRLIVSTRAYQRSSKPYQGQERDKKHFSHALIRPLDPEQVFASIVTASGIERALRGKRRDQFQEMKLAFERQFVHKFQVDEPGERTSFQENVNRALFILNSRAFNGPVRAIPGGTIQNIVRIRDNDDRVKALTRSTFTRNPTDAETDRILSYVREKSEESEPPPDASRGRQGNWLRHVMNRVRGRNRGPFRQRRKMLLAWEDVLWSMLASTEFLVNH